MAVPRGPMNDDMNYCSELNVLGVLHTLDLSCGKDSWSNVPLTSPPLTSIYCCDASAASKGSDSLPAHLEEATSCR